MTFVSLEFIVFLPIVLALYYITTGITRKFVLLGISFYFYAAFLRQYALVLYVIVFFVYFLSIILDTQKFASLKKAVFLIAVLFLILILILFKYYGFLSENLFEVFRLTFIPNIKLFAFIGISFITFQLLSYLIDVYNNKVKAERNIIDFILFVTFFPKIISGPIERAGDFLPQIKNTGSIKLEYDEFMTGFKTFIWGFFLKVVIADRLGPALDRVFINPDGFNSGQVFMAVIFYTVQLYTDFGGYSYMALGSAKMLGFNITNNFFLPLFSGSVSDFWRRWHISLSKWLRDYVFLPISYSSLRFFMKRKNKIRKPENPSYLISTLVTMTVCGIWHGPKWTFILWGFIHGFYLAFSFLTRKKRKNFLNKFGLRKSLIIKFTKIIFTFLLIAFAFVVFRADTLELSFRIFLKLMSFDFHSYGGYWFYSNYEFIISVIAIAFLLTMEYIIYRKDRNNLNFPLHEIINTPMLILIILLILFLGNFTEIDFLYFKF